MDAKAIVRRCFEDIVAKGDTGIVDQLLSKDVVFHTATGAVLRGRNEFKHFVELFHTAFPDIAFEIEEEIADGDRVCTRYVMHGTFLETLWGVLPTGTEFSVRGIDTFRVVDGHVVEIHASYDTLGQMQQLGVVAKL